MSTPPRWMRRHDRKMGATTRRSVGFFTTAAAGSLAAVSVAWACTASMGSMSISPKSGPRGTKVTANATNLKPVASYKVVFNNSSRVRQSRSCHSAPTVLRSSVGTSATGSFSTTVRIPTNAPLGLSEICAMETAPVPNSTASTHERFTVT